MLRSGSLQRWIGIAVLLSGAAAAQETGSVFKSRLDDPHAVYLKGPAGGERDDTAAIQAGIDTVQKTRRGILFVPEGRYRVSATLHVWAGIRVIGFGARRPVFALVPHAPGFAGKDHRDVVMFAADRPADAHTPVADANSDTFFSAMDNVDLEIGEGNPSAVGVRFHVAQHSYLAHMRIDAGDGFAAVEEAGNMMNDLELVGGRYGLISGTTSPSWPFVLMDTHLHGQRVAALDLNDASPVLVRLRIDRVPTAIQIDPPRIDRIVLRDSTLEEITGPAISLGNAWNQRMGLVVEELRCRDVAVLLEMPERAAVAGPGTLYVVSSLRFGLELAEDGSEKGMTLAQTIHAVDVLPPAPARDVAPLPDTSTWVNVRQYGAHGDGFSDDTKAVEQALATGQPVYLPTGAYVLSHTLELPANAILIGLHSQATRFVLRDGAAGFGDSKQPRAMVETHAGDAARLSGFGLSVGAENNGAIALLWRSGERALLDDVRFLGGRLPAGVQAGEHDLKTMRGYWDRQPPSLVVRGGGGTLRDLWSPSTFSTAGVMILDTALPSHVYLLSVEHHLRQEVLLDHVQHWSFYAMQTEEEAVEGAEAISTRIHDCTDLKFYNLAMYRVSRSTKAAHHAIEMTGSKDVTLLNPRDFSISRFAFDNMVVFPEKHGAEVRSRFFNQWHLGEGDPVARVASPLVKARLSGYTNVSSLSAAPDGSVYFLDYPLEEMMHWNGSGDPAVSSTSGVAGQIVYAGGSGGPVVMVGRPADPVAYLAGKSFKSIGHDGSVGNRMLLPTATAFSIGSLAQLPGAEAFFHLPDGLSLPLERKSALLRGSSGVAPCAADARCVIATDDYTASFTWHADRTIAAPEMLLPRGGDALVTDPTDGTMYLASGDVFVYTRDGHAMGSLHMLERPVSLAVQGKTLYVGSRTTIYRIALPISAAALTEP